MAKRICTDSLKFTSLLIIDVFFIVSAFTTYVFLPHLVQTIVRSKIILSPESIAFADWRKIPTPIYTSFYFFNITNAEDIVRFQAKPIVKELGPYTYLEEREKINIEWNENGTVSYEQLRRWHFEPEKSVGSLDDLVVYLNVPLVSAGEEIYYSAINEIAFDNNETLFNRNTIRQLLFDGVEAKVLGAAQTIGVDVPYEKFGWFYQKNNTAFDGIYRIFNGQSDTLDKLGFMDAWNNQNKIHHWNREPCSKFDRSSPGDLRPPYMDPRPEYINLFSADICRTLKLKFLEEVNHGGLLVDRYQLDSKAFEYGCPENDCYCPKRGCPKNGVFNTSLCTHNSPSAVSFPHFLSADTQYNEMVDGLEPDESKHSFYLDIDQTLGVVVSAAARLQVNIVLEKDSELEFAEHLKHDITYFPMFWFETLVSLDKDHTQQLSLLQSVPKYIAISALVQLAIAVLLSIITLMYGLYLSKNNQRNAKRPKCQYQAVKMINTNMNNTNNMKNGTNGKLIDAAQET